MTALFLISFALLFGLVARAGAENYYVDYSTGSDSANGTSTSTPWKHCPGDTNATGTASSATFSAGDTVFFKGGVSYIFSGSGNKIALNWSGTLASPIIYDGNSAGTWGTGKAVITDNHRTNSSNIAFYTDSLRSNLVFRSFNIKEIGGSATLPADLGSAVAANYGFGMAFRGGAKNIIIRDCDFSEIGYYFNEKPMDTSSISGGGVSFVSGSQPHYNVLVTNCNFSRMSIACQFSSVTATNIEIANCTFTDSIRWCVDLAIAATGAFIDFISVHDCTFYDYWQFNTAYWTGYGEWPHVDGIFHRCDYDYATYGTNINFYDNLFYFTVAPGGGTAPLYLTAGPSANIYNNVFINSGMANGNIQSADGRYANGSIDYVNIYNNTFYGSGTPCIRILTETTWNPVANLRVENNIFYDALVGSGANVAVMVDPGAYHDSSWMSTNWFFNRNIYLSFNWSGDIIMFKAGYWRFTHFQNIGWEAQGKTNNPLFADITQGFTNTPNQNLRPRANSPARSAGTNLSSLFATDKDGNARPSAGAWDIGAFQYVERVIKVGTVNVGTITLAE